ncbi:hypothetical protein EY643_16685 [Halioglobus maricola]|uniref:Cytochrome c domain-containing protein n=1 Tax=Halioglobus maricola TaxID=2601894 RepID=A0A5P9NMW0_9GAMM|nr:hypothetical protein [Halioglobus maricola]QFU77160.1 hypothetical protein EY643_16685 [Halioglobus maricola]
MIIQRRGRNPSRSIPVGFAALALGMAMAGGTLAADPFAFNNTVYPTADEWPGAIAPVGTFRTSNYAYPEAPVAATWVAGAGLPIGAAGLDQTTAPQYVAKVKEFLAANGITGLVNDPHAWNPVVAGWYDMPWGGAGSPQADGTINPFTGRDPIQGSYAGQIIQSDTFYSAPPPGDYFENHSVVYYNDVAGAMLGQVWQNPFQPDPSAVNFPEGSIVVKVEGAAVEGWDALEGSTPSWVYRPTAEAIVKANSVHPTGLMQAEMVKMYFAQMAVKVRDSVASPETGWVFIGFTYGKDICTNCEVWDKVVAVGAMWGNDPDCARTSDGFCPNGAPLQETWYNTNAPSWTQDSLGWGHRLAAPMDVAKRHNVITLDGSRHSGAEDDQFAASSCMSCHGSAQYPFGANLYPSPNMVFPADGQEFLFYNPGSEQWANWFQNRPPQVPMSAEGHAGAFVSLDYDMMLTLALMTALSGAGDDAFLNNHQFGH